MTILEQWRKKAYTVPEDQAKVPEYEAFWKDYFDREKAIYEELLKTEEPVKGTVRELSERFGMPDDLMVGFLDGINDSLVTPNPIETMDMDTEVSLEYDKESLYKNMVIAKADWLYNLPEWDAHLSEEERESLFREAKKANTIVKGKKIGRNDPCPCGSGKKYKFCCGRNK